MFEVEVDREIVEEEYNEALCSAAEQKVRYPSMTYEEGVRDALAWVLGERDDAPLTGDGD